MRERYERCLLGLCLGRRRGDNPFTATGSTEVGGEAHCELSFGDVEFEQSLR